MSSLSLSHLPTVVGHGISQHFARLVAFAWVGPVLARLTAELKIRTAIAELQHMSDRQLDDVGVARADIVRAVRGPGRGFGRGR